MTLTDHINARGTGYPLTAHSFGTIEERIAACCEWFNIDPPTLEYDPEEPDAILLTDELIEWIRESECSMAWILSGDARSMALTYREKEREHRSHLEVLNRFDNDEQKIILEELRRNQDAGSSSLVEAIDRIKARLEERRNAA